MTRIILEYKLPSMMSFQQNIFRSSVRTPNLSQIISQIITT